MIRWKTRARSAPSSRSSQTTGARDASRPHRGGRERRRSVAAIEGGASTVDVRAYVQPANLIITSSITSCDREQMFSQPTLTLAERVTGCLKGIATGDAVGKQTELLSYADVLRWYPYGIRGFEGLPGSVIPRYVGNRKREWRVGETTDDTERTIAVARAIIAGQGRIDHTSIGREMLQCRKSVHPGVKSLWEFHQAGDPARIATRHDGCGAAIRVGPVGIVVHPDRLDDLVNGAREASIPTHGGLLAIAAAAATAAAVSAAIEEWPADEISRWRNRQPRRPSAGGQATIPHALLEAYEAR